MPLEHVITYEAFCEITNFIRDNCDNWGEFCHNTSRPSTTRKTMKTLPSANAIMRLAKLAAAESHYLSAHCAFHWTQGTVSIARRRWVFFVGSLTYVLMSSEYVLLWMFSTAIWKP